MPTFVPGVAARAGVRAAACAVLLIAVCGVAVGAVTPAPSPAASGAASAVSPAATLGFIGADASGTIPIIDGTWQLRVPVLVGLSDPAVQAAVNQALVIGAAAQVAWFQRQAEGPTRGFRGTDQYQSDFTVTLLTPELASLRVTWFFAPVAAAHGIGSTETWTFDLATGRKLQLRDLFLAGSPFLVQLSQLSRPILRGMLPAADWRIGSIRHGTRPTAENFARWALTPDGLEFTFDYYQVGSFAEGSPVIVIPWAGLTSILDPAGPAAPILAATPAESGSPEPTRVATPAPSGSPVG